MGGVPCEKSRRSDSRCFLDIPPHPLHDITANCLATVSIPDPSQRRANCDAISSLVSMYQPGVRRKISAELHRVPMQTLQFFVGGSARHAGAGSSAQRR